MKVFELMNSFFSKMRQKKELKKQKDLVSYTNHLIQFREFDSRLFIAYNGIPLIEVDRININVLNACRNTYIKYCGGKTGTK